MHFRWITYSDDDDIKTESLYDECVIYLKLFIRQNIKYIFT